MILAGGQRRQFNEKQMGYLFSHDLVLASDPIGFVPGGLLLDVRAESNNLSPSAAETRQSPCRAFHALGDDTVLGNDAVEGTVIWFSERLLLHQQTDSGSSEARLTVLTSDGALISARYQGKLRLGRMGYRRFVAGSQPGGEPGVASFEAKAFVALRFETDSSKYRWLTERQCVAYGRLAINEGVIASAKYDVYYTA